MGKVDKYDGIGSVVGKLHHRTPAISAAFLTLPIFGAAGAGS